MNIAHTLFMIDQHIIDSLKLDSGNCHIFASKLGELSGRDFTIHLGLRHIHYEDDDDFSNVFFSHAVVEIEGEFYDCHGDNAIDKWENRWDPSAYQDEDGEISSFEWIPLTKSPSLDTVMAKLKEIGFKMYAPITEDVNAIASLLSIGKPVKRISI